MDEVNKLLDAAVKDCLISDLETLKKIVGKLSAVKATDGHQLTENEVNNWLSFFLPVVFNQDKEIQTEVIRGLELLIPKLHKCPYQEYTIWPNIRKEIVETYTKHVRGMFKKGESEWHVIFNILLKILDSVIANSTASINTFLPIVEMGFRSDNFQMRADAFLCWKEIIKIFIKFGQISDPKRIKLIQIPLKSSRSKTQEIAENKFDVWWTLIQALGDKLLEHSHLIESFIYFCVGPLGKQKEPLESYLDDQYVQLASPGKIYDSIRDYSIVAIAYMLGKPNRSIQRLAKQTKITFNENSNVCNEAIFDKIGNTLIAACIETTVLISKIDSNQVEINDCIWNSLLTYITDKNAIKYRGFILESLALFKKLVVKLSKTEGNDTEMLRQLIAGAITACVSHQPFVTDASTNEINEMINIINVFIDDFKPKQISGMPASIKARIKFEPKKTTTGGLNVSGIKSPGSAQKSKKEKEEFVAIPTIWKFNPETLTEHQRERMKERREDIPSLYDGNSQNSQDTEVKPWNPKQIVIAGDQSHDTMVLNDNSNSTTPVITRLSKKDSDTQKSPPLGPSPRKALTRSGQSQKTDPSPKKNTNDKSPMKEVPAELSPSKVTVKTEQKSPVEDQSENQKKGTGRRKNAPKSLKDRKMKVLATLAIDTVEGKKLMKELQNQPDQPIKRRSSIDRGAKRVEPSWKQSLIPNKKTRKSTRGVLEEERNNTEMEENDTPSKKVLSQQNDNNKSVKTIAVKLKETSEQAVSQISKSSENTEDEVVEGSQDPELSIKDRRRSRRESQIFNKSQKTEPEKSDEEKREEVSRNINFDSGEANVRSTRNSPRIDQLNPSPTVVNRTPVKSPIVTEQNSMNTPEKLVLTPTVRSSPRKVASTGETQQAAVPHVITAPIASGKSTSPTEASTANSTDVEMLNELRRSPRKTVSELTVDTKLETPILDQMSPMKVVLNDCRLNQELASPDRRKSPRNSAVAELREIITPPLSDLGKKKESPDVGDDHGYAKKQKLSDQSEKKTESDESEEEVNYQIQEEEENSDENNKEDENDKVFMGEIITPTSPTPNLDEQMEPIDRSMTIPSSPDVSLNNEKTSEFLNNTLDISPIATGKSSPITRLAAKNARSESPTINVSPPERKATRSAVVSGIVNLDSPKTSNVYQGGRGAHMMSMVFKQNSSTPNQPQATSSRSFNMGPPKNVQESRDILTFSKTLPGPDASPSASILKRKLDESMDDIESPANKRKRVSFHDPPVSITKEYIRHEEEIRSPSIRPPINRCLLMAAVAQQKLNASSGSNNGTQVNQYNYTLKRKSKRDSSNDLRKLESMNNRNNTSLPVPKMSNVSCTNENNSTIEMSTLMLNDQSTNQSQMETQASQLIQTQEKDTSIRFGNKNEVLQYVMNSYQLEEILEMYFEEKKSINAKAARIMARELSNQMETDSKLRYSILDRLSEKHASEFLEHAIQENPSKAICERLTLPVILNFIMEKAGNDAAAKLQILKKFETFIAGDEQTGGLLTKQELMTFLLNCLPEEMSVQEMTLILDELFRDKTGTELYDTLTSYFRKYFVNQ
uniref:CSON003487 protein n=1 Tax=Culicoides sonorensis TaxID=179676 RepID=A0A336MLY3_CULSO